MRAEQVVGHGLPGAVFGALIEAIAAIYGLPRDRRGTHLRFVACGFEQARHALCFFGEIGAPVPGGRERYHGHEQPDDQHHHEHFEQREACGTLLRAHAVHAWPCARGRHAAVVRQASIVHERQRVYRATAAAHASARALTALSAFTATNRCPHRCSLHPPCRRRHS
jgi:hypothetical protein